MHVYFTRVEALRRNLEKVAAVGNILYKINPTTKTLKNLDPLLSLGPYISTKDEYDQLNHPLYVCVGAKVYLNANLNTQLGLYNSSEGTVEAIIII